MLTDPNPPNPTAPSRPTTPPITLDANTFRRFVTAAWSRPRSADAPVADRRAPRACAPDVLVAHRLKSFS
ncbi:MAG: hypothetical protein ACXWCM_00735 [Acidimicrobiales bacterium]